MPKAKRPSAAEIETLQSEFDRANEALCRAIRKRFPDGMKVLVDWGPGRYMVAEVEGQVFTGHHLIVRGENGKRERHHKHYSLLTEY